MASLKSFNRIALIGWLGAALAFAGTANACFGESPSQAGASVTHADGTESRFYTTGPAGTSTFRVDLSSTRQILSTTQVLRDEVFRQIQPGLNASEVLAIIGPPYRKDRFEATKTTAWDYNYQDTWGYDAEFSVIFDDAGVVVGKFSSRTSNN
jgi:hypothetical protein